MKNSETYRNLYAKLDAYEKACEEFEAEKEKVRDTYGVCSDEYSQWWDEHDKPEYPLTGGEYKAFRLIHRNKTDELVFDDFVWESEAHDFIATLREAGAKTMVVTNQSTALMENMHWFEQEGCRMVGLCNVKTGREDIITGEPEIAMGVRFEF